MLMLQLTKERRTNPQKTERRAIITHFWK